MMAGLLALGALALFSLAAPLPELGKTAEPRKALEDALRHGAQAPLKVEVADSFVKVTYDAGPSGLDMRVLPFASAANIKLQEGIGTVGVTVQDAAGGEVFVFMANDCRTARQFMVALVALHARTAKKP